MSSLSSLTPPGSSTYSSNTLQVGDGTWDSQRNTFLLPNLMGVNFETMRYNGMANRFKDMAGYHSLILAHGVIATIVFLGIVPMSTLIIRYYSRWNPFWAFKLHAWFQVLTLLLTTVVFVLGWFAVGPERSLTNPHHGIGLAIYVMVIFQVLWGWYVHKVESKRRRRHVPMKLVFHRWMGRGLAILGIVQIPLGLTLYGSPKVLFILFTLASFALLLAYFILSYLYDTEGHHMGGDYDGPPTQYTGPSAVEEQHHSRLPEVLAGGAFGAGLASMLRRRPRSRNPSQAYEESRTSYSDEKYSDEVPHRSGGGWGKRLLEIGTVVGAGALAKKFWDRRKEREDDAESGRYRPAHTRSDSFTEDSLSRLEDGRPEPTHQTPLNRPPSAPPSRPQSPGSSYYYNSTYYTEPEAGRSHGLRNAILGAGAFAAVKKLFGRGKDKEEKGRLEEIRRQDEDERLQRANSKRRQHTGEGFYPQRRRTSAYSDSELTPTDMTPRPAQQPPYGQPPYGQPPYGQPPGTAPVTASGSHPPPSDIPPIPPTHQELSGDLGRPRPHSHDGTDFAAGAAAGAAAAAATSSHRRSSGSRPRDEQVESPPVSVKVKMHNDGRHVTLRRLTEEEAAASREARRRERRSSRRRTASASSFSGNEGSYDHWRRVEGMERQQAEQMRREQAATGAPAASGAVGGGIATGSGGAGGTSVAPSGSVPASSWAAAQSQMSPMPAPPRPPPSQLPIPQPAPSSMPYGPGSITSPGTTWTGTEASGSYANNRRRRRAERARARQDRQQSHGVEFT